MINTPNEVIFALGLTLLAGLSTGIGSLIAFMAKRTNTKFLSCALGLSAGVMIYVSFMELMPEATNQLSNIYSPQMAEIYMLAAFFIGIAFITIIDLMVPEDENPHEIHTEEEAKRKGLKRTGMMLALAIGIHNFPEGMATFTTALTNIDIAIPICFAIAVHNIPEGIAVSVPIYQATQNRKKAFILSFLSGMAEPVGALLGYLFLAPIWNETLNAAMLAFVSGIMIYISFDELLPSTEKFGHHHLGLTGVILGFVLMAGSLLIL